MGATEEQMELISNAGITHISYILVLYSFAFIVFLFVNMLLHLYAANAVSPAQPKDVERQPRLPRINGHRQTDSRQIRDAEEFELEGLMSEDDGLKSPSTVGKNNEARVE
jgi:hypothetical protein